MESGDVAEDRARSVYVFNPFAEGFIARGSAFTPRKHQAMLAEDLANLPQFLTQPRDIVLSVKCPSSAFLQSLEAAGFPSPEFIEIRGERLDSRHRGLHRQLGRLRPWAWAPDSIKLLEPLFPWVSEPPRTPEACFNDRIARLYSKVWSANFLRYVLDHARVAIPGAEAWLCSDQEAGVAVSSAEEALAELDAIRSRGHVPVVVKEEYGSAGNNALRLWEAEVSTEQQRWLERSLQHCRQLLVEPWLERVADFSVQLEMTSAGLKLHGYTGLLNDHRGQFLANWAEPGYTRCLPTKVAALFPHGDSSASVLESLYSEVASLLERELRRIGYTGPVSIDAFAYRTRQGECRLKPVVEVNPRYTMGRVALELMKHATTGTCGRFRLLTRAQVRAEGYADFPGYARAMLQRVPLRIERLPQALIQSGALCLNDPDEAQVCVAIFEVTSQTPI